MGHPTTGRARRATRSGVGLVLAGARNHDPAGVPPQVVEQDHSRRSAGSRGRPRAASTLRGQNGPLCCLIDQIAFWHCRVSVLALTISIPPEPVGTRMPPPTYRSAPSRCSTRRYGVVSVTEATPMKTIAASALVLCMSVSTAPPAAAQTPVGEALGELGSGCRVGLTFGRCAAYAVAHDSNNTALDSRGAPLPPAAARQPTFRHSEPRGTVPPSPRPPAAPAAVSAAQQQPSSPSSSELEVVFWQSIATSTNPAEFEAYLRQFPNGIFRELAQIRLEALRAAANDSAVSAGTAHALVGAAPGRAGDVFRDCTECPEMVVTAGGRLAMGRYEVTVAEYRAFVSATGGTGNDVWRDHDYFPQTDRHPVTLVSLGGRAGVCVVAEPADRLAVSAADGGGVGASGARISAGMLRRPHGSSRNVPCRFVRLEPDGPVGHAWQRRGVDLRPPAARPLRPHPKPVPTRGSWRRLDLRCRGTPSRRRAPTRRHPPKLQNWFPRRADPRVVRCRS